ncbi:hypothetical protein [Pulveribacter sp.]|uniref:hypothetical protein n=1 Tax=Pulveribacter sp. TaxID=2678893 RepID=UPI00289B4FAA|nr:hypothetical protein [Pulveribacter sp.]
MLPMPTLCRRALALTLGGLLLPALAQADPAAAARRDAQRAQLQRERQAIEAQLAKDEAACYRRFAVEDCLRRARAEARERDAIRWRQELELNDEERREKAEQRRRSIDERQQAQPVPDAPAVGQPPRGTAVDAAQRAQQARERAGQQSGRQAEHEAQRQRRAQEQAEQAERSRERFEERQEKARKRREAHERERANAEAAGRAAPRPLPEPAADQ